MAQDEGTSADDSTDPTTVLMAAVWGFVSAASLLVGSVWGVYRLPKQSIRAAMMAFGGGSLLFALSIELFGHVLHVSEEKDNPLLVVTMICTSIFGGVFFAWLNRVLNNHGADIRHAATRKPQVNRLRKMLSRKLLKGLQALALFQGLTPGELQHFIVRRLQRRRVRKGHQFFGPDVDKLEDQLHQSGNLYMVLKGQVKLDRRPLRCGWIPPDRQWSTKVHRYRCFSEQALLMPEEEVHDANQRGKVVGATAEKDSTILVLPEEELISLIKEGGNLHEELLPLFQGWCAETLLDHTDMFKAVPMESWEEELFPLMTIREYGRGDEILKESNALSPLLFVLYGCIEYTANECGTRKDARASALIGFEHLRTGHATPICATATEPTCVLSVSRGRDLEKHIVKPEQKKSPPQPDTSSTKNNRSGTPPKKAKFGERGLVFEEVNEIESADMPSLRQQADLDDPGPSQLPGMAWEEDGKVGVPRHTISGLSSTVEDPMSKADEDALAKSAIMSMPVMDSKNAFKRSSSGWAKVRNSVVANFAQRSSLDMETAQQRMTRRCSEPNRRLSGWDLILADQLEKAALREKEAKERQALQAHRIQFEEQAEVLPFLIDDMEMDIQSEPSSDTISGQDDADIENGARRLSLSNKSDEDGGHGHGHGGGASAAVMVWVGILLDAIPESLVIGILVVSTGGPPLSFIIGVFLSNLPESMSSSGTMKVHGIPVAKILLMWVGVVIVTTLGSTLGAILFPPSAMNDPATAYVVVGVEGVAAGAMLTMIAQTMLPEAFEQGGDVVGLSCLCGFLAALSVRFLPVGGGGH